MKSGQRLWTEDELILTINLYAKLPFGKMHHRNKEVQELAKLINRTPDSVARRLGNFASLDPVQQGRGIKGLSNAGSLTEKVWSKFYNDWDNSFEESERLLAGYRRINTEQLYPIDIINEVGLEKERLVKTRLNQYRFRLMVLSNYNTTCCITGINQPELLVASHISPWSQDQNNRLNPANGLCFNALHDKAFDNALITIKATDYTLVVSPKLKISYTEGAIEFFKFYEGKPIILPKKFLPNPLFLEKHNEYFDQRNST